MAISWVIEVTMHYMGMSTETFDKYYFKLNLMVCLLVSKKGAGRNDYTGLSLKGTATLMITMFYMKDLNKP